jgi:hypothetical protein
MADFPVHCTQGHRLKDVYDLPCPTCGCQEAIVSMAARGQGTSGGRGALSGHATIEEMRKNWPLIGLLLIVTFVSGVVPCYLSDYLSGWRCVAVSWAFSIISACVGYCALTRILRQVKAF